MFDVSCLVFFYLFALKMALRALWMLSNLLLRCSSTSRWFFLCLHHRVYVLAGSNLQNTPTQKVRKTSSPGHLLSKGHCED